MPDSKAALEISPIKANMLTESVETYWGPERMRAARPIPINLNRPTALRESLSFDVEVQAAAEERVETRAPDGAGAAEAQPQAGAGSPLTERVPNRTVPPYCMVGKLFMTFNGADYVGSAWTVAESGVFTAAHCIYSHDEGGWADKLLFVPQYADGAAPVGRWTFTQIACPNGWTANGDDAFAYDLAVFKTERPIRPSTGSLGWIANAPPNQGPYTGIGYPAAGDRFDGTDMWRSTGAYIDGSAVIQAYNDMTGGCSGGPWAVWRDGAVYANGLNSFRYNNNPNTMYSPYFGEAFLNLYNWVK